jgi:hypothetical protein
MNEEDLRKQAWDFFQVQAAQRLTTFNFYIALSSLMSGGLALSLKPDTASPFLTAIIGGLITILSLVFWKLDERNRHLIKSAEETLKFFEQETPYRDEPTGRPHVAKRFLREAFDTEERKKGRSLKFWQNDYSYADCFRAVFLAFALVGTTSFVYAILLDQSQRGYFVACR